MINFLDISYLKYGNEKQRNAFQVLTSNRILEKMANFQPILVGTIPIEIDIETSDLDIICYVQNTEDFKTILINHFQYEQEFLISEVKNLCALKAKFVIGGFEIEIFGQNIPVEKQDAYRHMLTEYKILIDKGEDFRQKIIGLKNQGFKTEPAFAELLALKGDAYKAMLELDV